MPAYDPFDPHSKPPPAQPAGSKTQHVQQQVNEVVGIMQQNISQVMDRGERLDNIKNKTEDLERGASHFRSGANRVRKVMWWKDMKLKLIIAAVVVVLLVIIIVPIVVNNNKNN